MKTKKKTAIQTKAILTLLLDTYLQNLLYSEAVAQMYSVEKVF